MVKVDGKDASVWGLPRQPMFEQKVVAGRWFTAREEAAGAPRHRDREEHREAIGAHVGDTVTIQTASGPRPLRIVGMTGTQMQNGLLFLTPLSTLRAILDSPDTVNAYWVRTTAPDHAPDRPDDDGARGSPGRGRLLGRHERQVRRPGTQRRREPPDQPGDRRSSAS